MKKALQVAMFSLLTVIGFNAQANEHHHETMSEAQPQVISATGEVKGIDLESKNHHPSRSDCCRELAGDDHALYHHSADENE